MKLVILDRDGVINIDSDRFIKSPDEWRPIPGALEAIARLNGAGFHVAVATNQSGIERGLLDMNALNAIHAKMLKAAQQVSAHIDAIYYCPHSTDTDCRCRKPLPGMFIDIGKRLNVALGCALYRRWIARFAGCCCGGWSAVFSAQRQGRCHARGR